MSVSPVGAVVRLTAYFIHPFHPQIPNHYLPMATAPCSLTLSHRTFGQAVVSISKGRPSICLALLESFQNDSAQHQLVVEAVFQTSRQASPLPMEVESFAYTALNQQAAAVMRQILVTEHGSRVAMGQCDCISDGAAVVLSLEFCHDGTGRMRLVPSMFKAQPQPSRVLRARKRLDLQLGCPGAEAAIPVTRFVVPDDLAPRPREVVLNSLVQVFRGQSGAGGLLCVRALMVLAVIMHSQPSLDRTPSYSSTNTTSSTPPPPSASSTPSPPPPPPATTPPLPPPALSISIDHPNRLVMFRLNTEWNDQYLEMLLSIEPSDQLSHPFSNRVSMFWATLLTLGRSALLLLRNSSEPQVRRVAAVSVDRSCQAIVCDRSIQPTRHSTQLDLDLVQETSQLSHHIFHQLLMEDSSPTCLCIPIQPGLQLPTDEELCSHFGTLYSQSLPVELKIGSTAVTTGTEGLKLHLQAWSETPLGNALLLLGAWKDTLRPSSFQPLFDPDPMVCYPVGAKHIHHLLPDRGYVLAYSGNLTENHVSDQDVNEVVRKMLAEVNHKCDRSQRM